MRLSQILQTVIFLTHALAKSPLTAYEEIQQTLNTYPLAIDFKNGPRFNDVFTPNAFANYTGPLANLQGIDAIRESLLASVTGLATQHQLGTTLIDIDASGKNANSTTYFTANLVSVAGSTAGDFTVLFGLYRDDLIKSADGWRISKRYLEFMTPNLGNLTLG